MFSRVILTFYSLVTQSKFNTFIKCRISEYGERNAGLFTPIGNNRFDIFSKSFEEHCSSYKLLFW